MGMYPGMFKCKVALLMFVPYLSVGELGWDAGCLSVPFKPMPMALSSSPSLDLSLLRIFRMMSVTILGPCTVSLVGLRCSLYT